MVEHTVRKAEANEPWFWQHSWGKPSKLFKLNIFETETFTHWGANNTYDLVCYHNLVSKLLLLCVGGTQFLLCKTPKVIFVRGNFVRRGKNRCVGENTYFLNLEKGLINSPRILTLKCRDFILYCYRLPTMKNVNILPAKIAEEISGDLHRT